MELTATFQDKAGDDDTVHFTLVNFTADVPASPTSTRTPFWDITASAIGTYKGTASIADVSAECDVIVDGWQKHDAITGVGDVIRTGQNTSSNYLHYDNGRDDNSVETADFEIDVSSATDYDKLYSSGSSGSGEDDGLHEADTVWRVQAEAAGTVVDGGYTTTFTPSEIVHSNIKIFAEVKEGHSRSYAYDDFDASVEKEWNETLTTFKVGIKLDPGNQKIWEDDASASKTVDLGTSDLSAYVPWTGFLFEGVVQDSAEYPTKVLTWTALAESSNGAVDGMMGQILFTPSITVAGQYRMFGNDSGLQYPGWGGTLLAAITGAVVPYLAPVVELTLGVMSWTSTEWMGIIAGVTIIENDAKKEIEVHSDSSDTTIDVDLSALSLPGQALLIGRTDVINGSVAIKSLAVVSDNGTVNDAFMKIDNMVNGLFGQPGQHATASFESTRPVYVKSSSQ